MLSGMLYISSDIQKYTKCQIWSIKPINQHHFSSANTSI